MSGFLRNDEKEAGVRIFVGEEPLLEQLALAFKRTLGAIEREGGIGAMKLFVLSEIGRGDGVSQAAICQEHGLDPSRVTRFAQALEGEGLIFRERDPEDNRVVRMYLTSEGRRLLEVVPALEEGLGRRVSGAMSEREVEELRRLLGLLAEAMKK
ncbi:MarR family winged helix-turn-helix transcriptional regulator [Rubrobacter calidifluminis]|uniref:MarR family winged helix-turn-helix transcriptional regulator n=1 Tax=Rubrobacter calidifluminis TaxID=1392640 RepID=UPI00235FB695|nr:MarR family transcriptional regulator [Rubrobacter calidifluminis]